MLSLAASSKAVNNALAYPSLLTLVTCVTAMLSPRSVLLSVPAVVSSDAATPGLHIEVTSALATLSPLKTATTMLTNPGPLTSITELSAHATPSHLRVNNKEAMDVRAMAETAELPSVPPSVLAKAIGDQVATVIVSTD